MASDPVVEVFEAWRARQGQGSRATLTEDRRRLISVTLRKGYTVDDLAGLVRYAYEADVDEARWWRGANDRDRTYLGLDNLLRAGKLADRIDRARAWCEAAEAGETAGSDEDPDDGVVLGPLARLRGRV